MKKKDTVNPITAFRKANESRKAVIMKSLKKAQDGIVQDTSAAQTLYKNTKPWEGKANLNTLDPERNIQLANKKQAQQKLTTYSPSDNLNIKNKKAAEENKKKLDVLNSIYPGYQTPFQKKKGGFVKRKK